MNKYKAQRTTVDGITFDSKGEANRWLALRLMERGGQIQRLARQVPIPLTCGGKPVLIKSDGYPNGRRAMYYADFAYFDVLLGQMVYEDHKGFDVPISRLKRAMVEAERGIVVRVVR